MKPSAGSVFSMKHTLRSGVALAILAFTSSVSANHIWRYEAERDLPHLTGGYFGPEAIAGYYCNGGWEAISGRDNSGFLTYGPYVSLKSNREWHTLWFELRLSDDKGKKNDAVVTLELYDASNNKIILRDVKKKKDLSRYYYLGATYQFHPENDHMYEFRVYWHGKSGIRLDHIGLRTPY